MSHIQFSSFQIAKMLNVSRQAVNQWIDKGYIASYRTPGGHRRVSRSDLIAFLTERSIPVPTELESSQPGAEPTEPPDIAIIDDDEDFTLLFEQALSDLLPSAEVRRFVNAMDGLIAVGAKAPSLLVLDLRMPEMDGQEVVRRLKNNPRTSQIPIMVVTGIDEGPDLDQVRTMNVERIVSKSTPLLEIARQTVDFLISAPVKRAI